MEIHCCFQDLQMVGFPYLYWFLPVTRAVTLSMLFLLEGKLVFNQAEDLDSSWYIYSSELVGSSNIYNGRALLVFKTNDIKPAIVNIHKEPTMRFKNLVSINPSTDTPGIYPIVLGWFEIYLPILGNWCVGDNQQNHNLSLNGEAWWSIM